MADYNPNYMAAYKQYGQSLQQVGARNLSGAGTSAMQAYQDSVAQQGKEGKTAGLGAPTAKAKEEQKTSFWDRITELFTSNDVDVTSVYTPTINPASLYDSDAFKAPEVKDYVYRAEMSELTQDMVEQAMGYEKPTTGQLQLLDTGSMTEEEKKRLGPLLKLADDIRNENITTTELPPVKGEEQSSLMDALMEGQPTAGLMSRPSSFTGGSVQVASNIPNWMQDMSAAELTDALVGIKEGTVDPDTGQPIQSAEDVAASTAMPDVAPEIDTAPPTQDSNLEDMMVDRIVELEGFIPTAKQAFANEEHYTIGYGTYGPQVKKGQTITRAEAEVLLREEELPKRVATARRLFDDFDTFSNKLKVELVQGIYRGDFKPTHKTVKLINEGKWTEASKEFLNHAEYKKAKREGKKSDRPGIVPRLEAISAAIYNEQF